MADFWYTEQFTVKGEVYDVTVNAHFHTSDKALAVTPELNPLGSKDCDRYVITHVITGAQLWTQTFPLEKAKALCLELLRLPGWNDPRVWEAGRIVEAATAIARRYLPEIQ